MGFLEYRSWMRAAAGAKAPPSLEENYRRWLRSMRDRIDSELAGEERAAEWLRKTLPRLEEDYRKRVDNGKVDHSRRRLIRRGDEMPEECKLQMLKDSVLGSMLRETEAEAGVRRIREKREERRRRRTYLAATGAMVSSFAVFVVSGILTPSDDMTLSEFWDFMCLETFVFFLFCMAGAVRNDHRPPRPARSTMKFCSGRSRLGLLELLPS